MVIYKTNIIIAKLVVPPASRFGALEGNLTEFQPRLKGPRKYHSTNVVTIPLMSKVIIDHFTGYFRAINSQSGRSKNKDFT